MNMTSDCLIDLHSCVFFKFFITKDNLVKTNEFAMIPILPSKSLVKFSEPVKKIKM